MKILHSQNRHLIILQYIWYFYWNIGFYKMLLFQANDNYIPKDAKWLWVRFILISRHLHFSWGCILLGLSLFVLLSTVSQCNSVSNIQGLPWRHSSFVFTFLSPCVHPILSHSEHLSEFLHSLMPAYDFCFPVLCCVVLSCFSCSRLFVTLWTTADQDPLPMRFSRQEYWSGLLCPPPGDLPDPRIKPMSLMSPALTGRFLTTSTTWEAPSAFLTSPHIYWCVLIFILRSVVSFWLTLFFCCHAFSCCLVSNE